MQKDAFYFPHFSNSRKDRKLKRVIKELGVEGYGIYFMLLEILREETGFKFPMEDVDLLADEFGTSEQKVRTVICNYKLFQIDEDENFFSMKFIEYLNPYLEGKHKKRIAGIKGNLIKYGYATKDQLKNLTDSEIIELNNTKDENLRLPSHCESHSDRSTSQSKVKESKVKESKVKESKVKESKVIDVVDYLNKKTGKKFKSSTDKTKKLITARYKEGFSIEDFKEVIDIKVLHWLNDDNMNKYLRPETLFGTKFEGYLNEKSYKTKNKNTEPQIIMDPDYKG